MPRVAPHFIIPGAPRSGTTYLYEVLSRHPEIYLASPRQPEPKFFLRDDLYALGFDYYLDTWFKDVPKGCLAGEKSSNYLENPLVAERIHKALPDIRLVFILRDPVDRAYSNYLWSRMHGHETEDFETALDLEKQREENLPTSLHYARPHDFFNRGLYAKHLRPYFKLFPREHILVLNYSDIKRDSAGLMERLHGFLGVALRPQDALDMPIVNAAAKQKSQPIPVEIQKRLRVAYEGPQRELVELLGREFGAW
jgi:hypothetical protein